MTAVDPILFTKSLEFAGVFRDGDLATKPLSIEIRYSPLNAHPPIGVIRGTAADWPELESFFHKRPSAVCELESVSTAEGREKVHSNQVLLRDISARIYPDDEGETIQQVLGRFDPHDITIDGDHGERDESNRQMTFLMTGPTLVWMSEAVRWFSYSGSTKTEFSGACLCISDAKNVKITAQPHFLYASHRDAERSHEPREDRSVTLGNAHLSVEAEVFALTVTDRDLDRTDTDFEAQALEVAEILCLLVTFLSKAYVTWYARTFWSNGRLREHFRDPSDTPAPRLRWDDIVLPPKEIRRFINCAFTAYQKGTADGVNLRLPILIYAAAQSAFTIEEQFILLFVCLEKIVGLLDQKDAWELIDRKELKTIAKSLRGQLRDMGKDPRTVVVVNEKISELKRPAFRRRLCRHLKRLSVDLDDIGSYDALVHTIKIRDSLIHGADIDIARVAQEQKRLQTVAERVLLTLLDWRGPTNTPTFSNRLAPNF